MADMIIHIVIVAGLAWVFGKIIDKIINKIKG